MRSAIVVIVLVCSLVGNAHAKVRPSAAPLTGERLYIAQIIDGESDRDDRLRPARLRRAIKTIDIDHDTIPDYLVDYRRVINTHWCGGDGSCSFELWRGIRGGHPIRVWNQVVREYKIARRGGETVFDFDFHGSNCGTFGSLACPASFAWDRQLARLVERPTPGGVTTVRLIDPIAVKPADVPASIMAASRSADAKCKAAGSTDETGLPATIPDIDGDGLRDWSLTISDCDKPASESLHQVLFVTAGNANNPIVAASGAFYSISIATNPASVARINQTETCGGFNPDEKVCTQTPMIWNKKTGKLDLKEP